MGGCVKLASPSRAQSRDSGAAGRVLVVLVLILSLLHCCCPIHMLPAFGSATYLPDTLALRTFRGGSIPWPLLSFLTYSGGEGGVCPVLRRLPVSLVQRG